MNRCVYMNNCKYYCIHHKLDILTKTIRDVCMHRIQKYINKYYTSV